MAASKTKTESTVPARQDLEQDTPDRDPDLLEEQAEEQEEAQKTELKAGNVLGLPDISDLSIAEQRSGGLKGPRPVAGKVDNFTKRDDNDVMEHHHCSIDLSNKDAVKSIAATLGVEEDEVKFGNGDYGVYLRPGQIDDETGYPLVAVVQLNDATGALVNVPYEALRPAEGGRR